MGNIEKIMGNGKGTKFWIDLWAGSENLKSCFSRFFHLCEDRGVKSVRWGVGRERVRCGIGDGGESY